MGSRSSARSWALALVATLTMAVSYADRQALAFLAPRVTAAFAITDVTYGWLLSAFSVAYMLGTPLAGFWIDRIGARRGLPWAVLLWSLIAAGHALVPGATALFVLRIALGLAEAPSFPGAAQTVHRVLSPEDRPRGFGILFVGSSIGAMAVPPLVAILESQFGFRAAFVGTALIGLLWLPLWFWATSSADVRQLLDTRGEVPEPSSISITSAAPPPGRSPNPYAAPADATEDSVSSPTWAVPRGLLVILSASPMMSFGLLWSSKFLAASYGLSLQDSGKLLWFPPLIYDLGSIGFGMAASAQLRREGPRSGPPRALLATACGLSLAIAAVPFVQQPLLATILIGVAMAGGGGLFALTMADLLARVPPGIVSTASGLSAATQSLAYVVASPLIGWGVQSHGYGSVLTGLGLWLLPGCVIWLPWKPPPRMEARLAV